jgi:predicted amidophosphoribosyltransferase
MYEGPLQEAILKSKKPIYEYLAAELGRRMAAWFARQEHEAYDCVVSTPQFWLKRLVRRTNSSEILAEAMAQSMRIPWHARWLRCRRMLRKQGTLKYAQRQKNVRGAFATNWWSRFAGKSVLLVDDILTSGAIGSELAATMKRSGAKHVDVVVVARGVGRHGIAGRAAQVDPMPGSRSTEKTIP